MTKKTKEDDLREILLWVFGKKENQTHKEFSEELQKRIRSCGEDSRQDGVGF